MLRQISFVPAIGNLCCIPSTSSDISVIISLCHSVYPWRINNKCTCRFSSKSYSTNKFRLYFDKNKRPKKNRYPPLKFQLDWDPFEDLFGVGIDMEPRNITFSRPEPRSWIGPNGQYVKELPCPNCRGRGYMLCTKCGRHRSSPSCPQCHGKGLSTCRQCLGECVIWEESVDELPWEKAHTSSPINIVEDDAIDKMEIELAPKRKSKRVYASIPPDVGAKISRTLRNLNAATGMFSKKMKKVHSDPILRAQRIEAMKRAKRTPAARQHVSKLMKSFFSNPENRLKRSLSMKGGAVGMAQGNFVLIPSKQGGFGGMYPCGMLKNMCKVILGVKFYCRTCGKEGHRSHYCPSLKDTIEQKRYKCRICGKSGHNRTTCKQKKEHKSHGGSFNCTVCGQGDHNSETCPQNEEAKGVSSQHKIQELPNNVNIVSRHTIKCSICCKQGHNARSCSRRLKLQNPKDQRNC